MVYEAEKFFDMAYVTKKKHVKFVAYKLKGAATWWDQLQITRTPRQTTCDDMVMHETISSKKISATWLPTDSLQPIWAMQTRYKNYCVYTEEFYHLSSRCDLSLIEEHQTSKYINRLKYSIQERMALQDVFVGPKAHHSSFDVD